MITLFRSLGRCFFLSFPMNFSSCTLFGGRTFFPFYQTVNSFSSLTTQLSLLFLTLLGTPPSPKMLSVPPALLNFPNYFPIFVVEVHVPKGRFFFFSYSWLLVGFLQFHCGALSPFAPLFLIPGCRWTLSASDGGSLDFGFFCYSSSIQNLFFSKFLLTVFLSCSVDTLVCGPPHAFFSCFTLPFPGQTVFSLSPLLVCF